MKFPKVLHGNHFRKDWQRRVKTWFDQPGRKLRRRRARASKAGLLGVKPLQSLRPVVRAQTVRYNMKVREGRGFTLTELKEAGIGRKQARGIGIAVDHRRRNLSEEGKKLNVERLKGYKTRLVIFPRNAKKPKKGDSTVRARFLLAFIPLIPYFRATTSRLKPLGTQFLFLKSTLMRLPAKLLRRRKSWRPIAPSGRPVLPRDTKAHEKPASRRYTSPHLEFKLLTEYSEKGGGGSQDQVNILFWMPSLTFYTNTYSMYTYRLCHATHASALQTQCLQSKYIPRNRSEPLLDERRGKSKRSKMPARELSTKAHWPILLMWTGV
jgi:ribosomal protein L13E